MGQNMTLLNFPPRIGGGGLLSIPNASARKHAVVVFRIIVAVVAVVAVVAAVVVVGVVVELIVS